MDRRLPAGLCRHGSSFPKVSLKDNVTYQISEPKPRSLKALFLFLKVRVIAIGVFSWYSVPYVGGWESNGIVDSSFKK